MCAGQVIAEFPQICTSRQTRTFLSPETLMYGLIRVVMIAQLDAEI